MEYKYWFSGLYKINNIKKIKLLELFENEKNIFNASSKKLLSTGLLNLKEIDYFIKSTKEYSFKEIQILKKNEINLITIQDKDYPSPLREIYDKPYAIFVKGTLPKSWNNSISIVGARNCSTYGRNVTEAISKAISRQGGLIISGMARGIDSAAHAGALTCNAPTIAVLGCGVDVCYPCENKKLYYNIINNGAIISEYPPYTQPKPHFFPQRNRIISGLSKAVIVTEARVKSGSLITADLALEQGKDIYAVPGRLNDNLSSGTNKLIYQGAGIITSVDDLLEDLFQSGALDAKNKSQITENNKSGTKISDTNLNNYDKLEKELLNIIDNNPIGLDELILKTNSVFIDVLNAIETLVNDGLITEVSKNTYTKRFNL